jgi:hypothetical protein
MTHDPLTTACIALYFLVILGMLAAALSKPAAADPSDVKRHRRRRRMRPDRAVRAGQLPRAIARWRSAA